MILIKEMEISFQKYFPSNNQKEFLLPTNDLLDKLGDQTLEFKEIEIAPEKKIREKNKKYLLNGKIRFWNGTRWRCVHKRDISICKDCNGNSLCIHNKQKYYCKICKGDGICIHGNYKNRCVKCKGSVLCIHNRVSYECKECKGGAYCIHNVRKYDCRECNGKGICIHGKVKRKCCKCRKL